MFLIKRLNGNRAINSNITNVSNEALLYTDYSSKWTRSDDIHIKNIEQCVVITKGHVCNLMITAQVKGTWVAGDDGPWILGNLPAPLNGGFQFCVYSWSGANGSAAMRMTINSDGWLKPWYNHPDPVDGTIFVAYCSYLTRS